MADDSSSSASTATASTAAAVETKKPVEKRSWADEAEAETAAKNGSEGEKSEEELKKIESLSISDTPVGSLLDDPDESEIKAVLLFSATFDETVKEFVSRVVNNGNQIFVKKEDLTLDKVKQYKVQCPNELAKMEVIKDKIFEFAQKVGQTIIFVRTRKSSRMLHQELVKEGYKCTAIQGAQKQEDRDKIIKEFKDGLTTVLITTDLLARGFDQSQVNLVVNFDLPVKYISPSEPDCEVYLHRIGRAGRFGRKGTAFNLLCTDRDKVVMEKIERHFNHVVREVPNWRSEDDFEAALKDAGLL